VYRWHPFPIKPDQILRFRRWRSELPEHRRNLTAMVAGVVHHVLQHVPEHRLYFLASQRSIFDDAIESIPG
jgi:hypothetical protein